MSASLMRGGRLSAAAVTTVVLLAGCVQAVTDDAAQTAPALDKIYDQHLTFRACDSPVLADAVKPWPEIEYECARLEVPLNYEDPEGRTAQIALRRIPARGVDPIGSLMLNPGGPGFPGTLFAIDAAAAWAENPLTERFDLVGFDPRGVGESTPAVDCYTDAERDRDAMISSFDSGPDVISEEEAADLYRLCSERSGGDDVLAHVGTRDAARDMDVLRAALGDDKLTFAGVSYGTRLGAVYAEMFPQNVRALVLDAAIDPFKGTERRVQQFTGMQLSFEKVAAFCAAEPDCPLGSDPNEATAVFQSLVRPLIESPIAVDGDRELTFNRAIYGVIVGLYAKDAWPAIIAGIAELRQGRGKVLLALRDIYFDRAADGSYTDTLESTLAINCLDEERQTPQQATELKQSVFDVAPFMDTGLPVADVRDTCEGWPVQPTLGYPYATDIEGLPDTLTVSVTGDGLTPHEGGVNLAEALRGSLLAVDGDQHGSIMARNTCVDEVVVNYLIDLTSPEVDTSCTL